MLLQQLKQKPYLLPPNVKLFVPTEYRKDGDNDNKIVSSRITKSNTNEFNKTTINNKNNPLPFNINRHTWPTLEKQQSNSIISTSNDEIWKEIRSRQYEIDKLKEDLNLKIQQSQARYEEHAKKIKSILLIISAQNKHQQENIERCYTILNDFMPLLSATLTLSQKLNTNINEHNKTTGNDKSNETSDLIQYISNSISYMKDRNDTLITSQRSLNSLVEQQDWNCKSNNTCGVHLLNWFETTGNEIIASTKPTSKRSDAIIDFGITNDSNGWTSEVLNEGTSDHFPILFQSPIGKCEDSLFRKTKWKMFNYFLQLIHEYWMSVAYNLDEQTFFSLFSSFISSLWDKCSTYESSLRFRVPWPPELVFLAKDEPEYNNSNHKHLLAIERFKQIEFTPSMPLEPITMNEVAQEWKSFKPKKSSDSAGTSAYMLKQLPTEYLGIITVLFNKCAVKGNFFEESKHAKVICLSKDGMYPAENKLRPISLLPNLGK
ncbi:unnamed protein product, partial [Rotaria magnacalcarata]